MNQSATRRSLHMLEHLAGRPNGVALVDIAAAAALPKSAAHRLLALLTDAGYVRQNRETGHYALTLKLTMLGIRHYVRSGIDDLSRPILHRLAHESGELARLAIVDGERLVWIDKVQGARVGLRYDPCIDYDSGQDVVLHATSTGRAWLATLPEEDALRIVEGTEFRTPDRFGPNAVRDMTAFRALLAQTKRDGFGQAIEEGEAGTAAVAVAVRDQSLGAGPAVATLSLAGPIMRFGSERRHALAGMLAKAAEELGGVWSFKRREARASGAAVELPTSNQQERHQDGRSIAAL